MVRISRLALLLLAPLLLALPRLAAAAPTLPEVDFLWRFTGSVTEVLASDGPDVVHAPFLEVGDPVDGLLGVVLPPGQDPAGVLGYSAFEVEANGGFFHAGIDILPDRRALGFEGALAGFLEFDGRNGALLALDGHADELYFDNALAQFRWGLDGGTIQQIANEDGQSIPSHLFSYRWTASLVRPRPVPEPGPWLLLPATAIAFLGLLAFRNGEREAGERS